MGPLGFGELGETFPRGGYGKKCLLDAGASTFWYVHENEWSGFPADHSDFRTLLTLPNFIWIAGEFASKNADHESILRCADET